MDKQDFGALVDLAMTQPGLATMRPVVEKEILHYDIFNALDEAGLLKGLVFQGGTSLRICRGSSRFSEDIDFTGGKDFDSSRMRAIKSCIEEHIGKKYGLNVEVKEPKDMDQTEGRVGVCVSKWQICVETAPAKRDMARQRIKVEIANIPSYSRELTPLRSNYEFMRGYASVMVNTESLDEIMADKLIAFPASTKHIRHRDIWDLAWLNQQGATINIDFIERKIEDYGIPDFIGLLEDAITRLPGIIASKPFQDQMERFIDSVTMTKTLKNPAFLKYLETTVGGLLASMQDQLQPVDDEEESVRLEDVFRM
jgi:predicted nucleotidyltransferase component of viral defense system